MVTTTLITLLSLCVILLSREILKLKKRLEDLHKETNNRISVTDQQTHLRINNDLLELNEFIVDTVNNVRDDIYYRKNTSNKRRITKRGTTDER